MNINEEDILTFVNWVNDNLPVQTQDDTLVVLKGCLICEHLLGEYLKLTLPHSNVLKGHRRFGVPEKILICRASSDNERFDKWVWDGVKKLNSLRNSYAHQLDVDSKRTLNNKAVFIKYIEQQKPPPVTYLDGYPLAKSILQLCSGLFAVVKTLENGKEN